MQNYVACGEHLGDIVAVVFWGKNPVSVENVDYLKFIDILDGIVVGALDEEGVTSAALCVEDADPIAETLYHALEDFKAGKTKLAMVLAGQALHQFTATMKPDCMNITDSDVATLKSMADSFMHPLSLIVGIGKHVILDGIAIEGELIHAV